MIHLEAAPTRFRSTVARGLKKGEARIEAGKGDYSAGLITGLSVITRGEALGHGMWIDSEFLTQVTLAINTTGTAGAKARFTHPDMSGDGLGKFLGRVKNARLEKDRVIADLHFSPTAHKTPEGDLAGYVLSLATNDPDMFGESIAFYRDFAAERDLALQHGAQIKTDDYGDKYLDLTDFESPDPLNEQGLIHARLDELLAVDTVDDPACNPAGLFSRTPVPAEADALLSYALGLSKERPNLTALSVDPDRAAGFISRWMDRHGLSLTSSRPSPEPSMSTATPTAPASTEAAPAATPLASPSAGGVVSPATDPMAEFRAQLSRYTTQFGTENGTKWFTEGKNWEQALELQCGELAKQLAARDEQIASLNQQIAAAKLATAGTDPVPTNASKQEQPGQKTGLGIKVPGK